jgi:PAS domain S-box-containing protein
MSKPTGWALLDPRRSLRAKVALSLALLGLLLTLAVALMAERAYREQLALSSGRALSYSAQQLALNFKLGLAERMVEIEQIATRISEPSARDDAVALRRGLDQLKAGRPEIAWIGLADWQGRVVAASEGLLQGRDVTARPWFQAGRKGLWLGDVHEALMLAQALALSPDNEPLRLLDIAAPVTDERGQGVGVLAMHLDWRWVSGLQQRLLEPLSRQSGVEALILNRNGEVLEGPPALRAGDLRSVLTQALQAGEPVLLRWPDGQSYLTAVSRSEPTPAARELAELGWQVLVRQPESKAFAPGARLHQQLLSGGLVLVTLLVLLSWLLAGRLARPLTQLADVAQRQRDGEAVRFSPPSPGAADEVATLAQALSHLDESRRLEAASRLQISARYKALFEHSPDAIYINRDGVVCLANPSCVTLFGAQDTQDLIGKTPYELFAPESRGVIEERRHLLIDQGLPVPLIAQQIVRMDGQRVDVEAAAAPFYDENQRSMVVILRDITARQQALRQLAEREEALRLLNAELEQRVQARTAQLSAANTELDAFAYAVSHDLRAPLRAVNGYAQLLQEECGPQLHAEGLNLLHQIRAASLRMADLIEGLLSLSRTAREELQSARVDLSLLALQLLEEQARNDPQAATRWEVVPGLVVQADGRMMHSALGNLLDNAWKYSRPVPQPMIRVASEMRDARLWICVQDNGVGFDLALAGQLFEPFHRLHRQDEFSGLGIGLATVQRIVARHGGELSVWSQPGAGTRVSFTLDPAPLATGTSPAPAEASDPTHPDA